MGSATHPDISPIPALFSRVGCGVYLTSVVCGTLLFVVYVVDPMIATMTITSEGLEVGEHCGWFYFASLIYRTGLELHHQGWERLWRESQRWLKGSPSPLHLVYEASALKSPPPTDHPVAPRGWLAGHLHELYSLRLLLMGCYGVTILWPRTCPRAMASEKGPLMALVGAGLLVQGGAGVMRYFRQERQSGASEEEIDAIHAASWCPEWFRKAVTAFIPDRDALWAQGLAGLSWILRWISPPLGVVLEEILSGSALFEEPIASFIGRSPIVIPPDADHLRVEDGVVAVDGVSG